MPHHWQNMYDHLQYLIDFNHRINEKEFPKKLPDEDPSGGTIMLVDGVILAVSESVSIQDRIAATVEFGAGLTVEFSFVFDGFKIPDCVSRVGVRRRKLTRFRND